LRWKRCPRCTGFPSGKAEPPDPGWEDLGHCFFTMSFDGTKGLSLSYTRQATLYDYAKMVGRKEVTVEGTWTFDEAAKRYAVTLDGAVTTYSVVAPEQTAVCILVKGDLGAADLRASWFSPVHFDDDGDDDGRERY
jgi:hypothetical protein